MQPRRPSHPVAGPAWIWLVRLRGWRGWCMFSAAGTPGLDTLSLHDALPISKRSTWRSATDGSRINREKALALAAAGRMRAPGAAEIRRAKADGQIGRAHV